MASSTGESKTAGMGGAARISTPPELLAAPGFVARRLYQACIAVWVRMVDSTLTGPQFAVLTAVNNYPGADQGSLASSVAFDRSTMADIVRRLEKNGLVLSHTAMHDGRRKLLYLTEEGARRLEEATRRARQLDERLLRGYGGAERERLLRELTLLAAHWEGLVGDE